ncbi:hypothetical protein AeMF1_004762 [Aphanomyces euteiches]|nr:hypothetical protein AeMF1_004762 [Aphanomyces euteiches]KAH9188725.1 hypothetical protein AeNC1_009299 [Aphanomyces euteiches]
METTEASKNATASSSPGTAAKAPMEPQGSLHIDTSEESNPGEFEQSPLIAKLSPNSKRALGGTIACALALVNDGSEARVWAQTYFRFVSEACCEIPPPVVEGLLPLVATERGRGSATEAGETASLQETPIDSDPFVSVLEREVTRDEIVQLLCFILWRTTHSVGYDARTRAMLRFATRLFYDIPWSAIAVEEVALGHALLLEANELQSKKKVASPRKWKDWRRNLAIGGAAVAGGTLLALTGGLIATPLLAAGFLGLGTTGAAIGTALGSSAAVTAATVLFGTAGAGLAGYKADRRTLGIKHFEFELLTPGDGMHVYICVAGWIESKEKTEYSKAFGTPREYLRAFYEQYCPDKLDTVDALMERYRGREDELFTLLRRQYNLPQDHDPVTVTLEQVMNTDGAPASAPTPVQLRAWQWKHRMPYGDQYCLHWEKDVLVRFYNCMKTFTTQMLMGYARGEILKHTFLAALYAAVALPTMVVNACNMIDSEWAMAMGRADKCGKLMAKALVERQQGLRPVSLLGYGMGARVIYSCLKHLAKEESGVGLVENAVLLGAAIPVEPAEWVAAKKVVAGRLINGYSTNDWMLAIMFRYQNFSLGSAGIGPIQVNGVENVDLSSIINGHMEYPNKIGLIIDVLKLE